MAESLAFTYGAADPLESMQLVKHDIPSCGPSQVVIQFLAAPINPLDFLVIHGKYPVRPQSTVVASEGDAPLAVPGSDGAGRVTRVGSAVTALEVGDMVILGAHCRGTWRTHGVFEADDLIDVPNTIDARLLSILRMGMAPAYFQLRNAQQQGGTPLEPGDWILQNAATGAIAHFVCQFAAMHGVRVASIVRDRDPEHLERTRRTLRAHGAALVLTERELHDAPDLQGKRIVLAIDAVADDALARDMAAWLAPGGTLLTAGFLGFNPGGAETPRLRQLLWQRNVTLQPFRLSDCLARRSREQQKSLFAWFAELLARGAVTPPPLEDVPWANEADGGTGEHRMLAAVHRHASGPLGEAKKVLVFS